MCKMCATRRSSDLSLYHRCTDAIKEMQSEMTALQIAPIVCGVVTKIEVDQKLSLANDDDSVESDKECDYTK